MANRKKLIEDIMASFHALRHKILGQSAHKRGKKEVTHSQWFVLGVIEQCKGTGIKKVAEMLGISSSAATQLVEGLVLGGLVARRQSIGDRRAFELTLSPRGKKHIALMRKMIMKKVSTLFSALSDSELETYFRLQQKLLTSAALGRNRKYA